MSNQNIVSARNWITIDSMDSEDYDKASGNNGWLKFDDNSECRYRDNWSFALVTHYSHT